MVGGAHRAAEGDRRLDRQGAPMSNFSTTGPTRTSPRCASPGRSRSRACRRIASSPADEEELIDTHRRRRRRAPARHKIRTPPTDFADMVLEHLRTAGVQQRREARHDPLHRAEALAGRIYRRRGPLHGRRDASAAPRSSSARNSAPSRRVDLVAAAREATEARFDVLIACAFNFDAHASELSKLGPLPILKAQDEPRPAHGRRTEEHRQGQPLRRVRRAGHRHRGRRRRADPGEGERRRRVRSRTPATSAPTTPRASPPGSSTPTTTRKASSSATPISSARTIPTRA